MVSHDYARTGEQDEWMDKNVELWTEISKDLTKPFPEDEVKILKQSWGEVRYITARMVMDRLDEALTPVGWTDRYYLQDDGSVQCTLSCYFYGWGWITRSDVGVGQGQDVVKAAYSDALKRTAVKFGIGRYLYADTPTQQAPTPTQQAPAPPQNWQPDPPPDVVGQMDAQQELAAAPVCKRHNKAMTRIKGSNARGAYDFWSCGEKGSGEGFNEKGYCTETQDVGTFD